MSGYATGRNPFALRAPTSTRSSTVRTPRSIYAGGQGGMYAPFQSLLYTQPDRGTGPASAPPATPAPPPSAPTPGSSNTNQPYDFSSDPIFQQSLALNKRTTDEAQASALARKKQLAIQFGDASGLGLDQNTTDAAKGNSFSVLQSLGRSYDQGVGRLDEQLNKNNLFYSGWRGKQLADASTGNQQNQYNARSRFQASVQDVESQLQAALLNAEWQKLSLLEQQYRDGLNNPGGAGGGGGGGGGDSGASGAYKDADGVWHSGDGVAHPGFMPPGGRGGSWVPDPDYKPPAPPASPPGVLYKPNPADPNGPWIPANTPPPRSPKPSGTQVRAQ